MSNLMTDTTDINALRPSERTKLGFVTADNTGGYYVAECEECGQIFPSQNCDGGEQIADSGDYGDCFCPHCGFIDPLECDNANLAWNVQQLKIVNLTKQLEAERQRADELQTERNTALRQASAARNAFDEQYKLREKEAESAADLYTRLLRTEETLIASNDLLSVAEEEIAALKADVLVMPDGLHPDTKALVLVFASAMAVKLHKAQKKYGYDNSWMDTDWKDQCQRDLIAHVTKGDPLDVAAYSAFAWHHGWPTAPKPSVKGE